MRGDAGERDGGDRAVDGEFGLAAAIVPSGTAIRSSTIAPPRTSDAVTPADSELAADGLPGDVLAVTVSPDVCQSRPKSACASRQSHFSYWT